MRWRRTPEEVVFLRAVRALCFACWAVQVREYLRGRNATSRELGQLVGADTDGVFWNWLRQNQSVAVRVGRRVSDAGHDNIVWTLSQERAA